MNTETLGFLQIHFSDRRGRPYATRFFAQGPPFRSHQSDLIRMLSGQMLAKKSQLAEELTAYLFRGFSGRGAVE